jgi:hypothetical protein
MHYNKFIVKEIPGAWIPGALAEYGKDKGKTDQEANGKRQTNTEDISDDYEWGKQVEPKEIGKLLYNYHKLNKKGKKPDTVFKTIALKK